MIFTETGNNQNDSCTLMNAEGYDIAVVNRVPGMMSDEQWALLMEQLNGESYYYQTIYSGIEVGETSGSFRTADERDFAAGECWDEMNYDDDMVMAIDVKGHTVSTFIYGRNHWEDKKDKKEKLYEYEVTVTYTDVKGGITEENAASRAICVIATNASDAEENAIDKLGEDGLCWDTITADSVIKLREA